MTIHAAGLVGNEGTAVAFEPSPTICQSLRQNIALNACTNVEVHQVALGEGSARQHTTLGQAQTLVRARSLGHQTLSLKQRFQFER